MDSALSSAKLHHRSDRKIFSDSPCLCIMLRQDELAFIKAISALQISPAFLKELRMTLVAKEEASGVCQEPQNRARRFV